MAELLIITHTVSISLSELTFRFSRSGGRGGQNVNKVETKVELLFDVLQSPSLTDEQRQKVLHRLEARIDSEGVLHITAQEHRTQNKNREEAIKKFVDLMKRALAVRKKRVKTKPSAGEKEKRLEQKKRRSSIKQKRREKHIHE
ncbi:MAG: aminoacyl-tRNA hydrolase [Ignavibacteriae bacterium]|nr:aminoacyl-tRNA hydrolase [Ignavibacteriota bacterium]